MEPEVKVTYVLEMRDPGQFRPVPDMPAGLSIERMGVPCPEFNKFMHTVIGYDYRWGGRIDWDKDAWYAYVNRPGMETWVGYFTGTPAGYFELEKEPAGSVHIHNFGLLPQFIGQGLGGPLLSRAIQRAWERAATLVWLSTCSHDHPHALNNYLARGFTVRETRSSPPNPRLKSFWELMAPGCQRA